MALAILRLAIAYLRPRQKIVDFALKQQAQGASAGLTASAGRWLLQGSFSAFGVRAQVGGTAVSKVLAKLSEAGCHRQSGHANVLPAVSGMSAPGIRKAWRDDAG